MSDVRRATDHASDVRCATDHVRELAIAESVKEAQMQNSVLSHPPPAGGLPILPVVSQNKCNTWFDRVSTLNWARQLELLLDHRADIPGLKSENSLCYVLFGWDRWSKTYEKEHLFDNKPDQFFDAELKERARVMIEQLRTALGALKMKSFELFGMSLCGGEVGVHPRAPKSRSPKIKKSLHLQCCIFLNN